jgi:hypothetical protein
VHRSNVVVSRSVRAVVEVATALMREVCAAPQQRGSRSYRPSLRGVSAWQGPCVRRCPWHSARLFGLRRVPANRGSSSSPVASGVGSARPTGGGEMPSICTACRL